MSGECQTKNVNDYDDDDQSAAPPPLDEGDIALLKSYGLGPYTVPIKEIEEEIKKHQETVKELIGIKESDTGLSQPSQWDLVGDKQMMSEEAPLQVARCTKIIAGENEGEGGGEGGAAAGNGGGGGRSGGLPSAMAGGGGNSAQLSGSKYVINVKQIAKFVVGLGEKVAPTDIEEGMRVGVDRAKYSIQIPLPPKIDPTVSLMTVEDKPDVTYEDVGGAKEAMEKLREVLETPLLHPERFVALGIEPPKGVLLYGPPGTGEFYLCLIFLKTWEKKSEVLCSFVISPITISKFGRQNSHGPSRSQQNRRLLHPRHRLRTRTKIRRRRSSHGPRALHHGTLQTRVHHLLRRSRRHWRSP